MPINWNEVNQALSPIKDYEDLFRRLRESFAYPFVSENYNFSMPELANYTQRLLGGDSRRRYVEYVTWLTRVLTELHQAGVINTQVLIAKVETREQLEVFTEQSGVHAQDVVAVLKYLIYWVIPMKKPLSGLVREELLTRDAIKVLRELGISTNLELLQQGITATGLKALADSSGLPETVILNLVNLADFSRLPWASKATIANIMGAGYRSLAQLANANPEQLFADFFRYGKAIGKNLKLGNEIENSYPCIKRGAHQERKTVFRREKR